MSKTSADTRKKVQRMEDQAMTIEPGKTYRDGWGKRHEIMGFAIKHRRFRGDPDTVYYDDVVWTAGGDWFYTDGRAHHRPTAEMYALKEEVK